MGEEQSKERKGARQEGEGSGKAGEGETKPECAPPPEPVEAMVCPRCGGKAVERKAKWFCSRCGQLLASCCD